MFKYYLQNVLLLGIDTRMFMFVNDPEVLKLKHCTWRHCTPPDFDVNTDAVTRVPGSELCCSGAVAHPAICLQGRPQFLHKLDSAECMAWLLLWTSDSLNT